MKQFMIAAATAACLAGVSNIPAKALNTGKPLEGYACMSLKAAIKPNNWVPGSLPPPQGGPDNPPVYQAPTENSERLGYQAGTVIVKWPLEKANGFIEIIRAPNGQHGWIAENLVIPYQKVVVHNATCFPILKSDGQIGFEFGHRTSPK